MKKRERLKRSVKLTLCFPMVRRPPRSRTIGRAIYLCCMSAKRVLIVGAGLSGLSAALYLHRRGMAVTVLEADDRPGGRVKTDHHEGFQFDHGFQVLLTAYPEARALLDYPALRLRPFLPGAHLLLPGGRTTRIVDPTRYWPGALATLRSPAGTLADKLLMLRLRQQLTHAAVETLFDRPEISTLEVLKFYGFSNRMVRHFFRPFLGGIFLERELTTSRRMFDFVFKMFSEGDTAVPAGGIGEIARQLAAQLPAGALRTHTRVKQVHTGRLTTQAGEELTADAVLLATAPHQLVERLARDVPTAHVSACQLYFRTDSPPLTDPIIALPPADGLVSNLAVMSTVAPDYAPAGQTLVQVSVDGRHPGEEATLAHRVQQELRPWFPAAPTWHHLRSYRVDYALPNQATVRHTLPAAELRLREGVYRAGDYLLNGSLNAAMRTGRLAAECIAADLA